MGLLFSCISFIYRPLMTYIPLCALVMFASACQRSQFFVEKKRHISCRYCQRYDLIRFPCMVFGFTRVRFAVLVRISLGLDHIIAFCLCVRLVLEYMPTKFHNGTPILSFFSHDSFPTIIFVRMTRLYHAGFFCLSHRSLCRCCPSFCGHSCDPFPRFRQRQRRWW